MRLPILRKYAVFAVKGVATNIRAPSQGAEHALST